MGARGACLRGPPEGSEPSVLIKRFHHRDRKERKGAFTLRALWEILFPADADLDQILPVRALQNHLVGTSPGVGPAELHDVQAWKDVVIKEAAEPARVPAAQGEGLARLVTCTARALDGDDLSGKGFDAFGVYGHGCSPFCKNVLRCWDACDRAIQNVGKNIFSVNQKIR